VLFSAAAAASAAPPGGSAPCGRPRSARRALTADLESLLAQPEHHLQLHQRCRGLAHGGPRAAAAVQEGLAADHHGTDRTPASKQKPSAAAGMTCMRSCAARGRKDCKAAAAGFAVVIPAAAGAAAAVATLLLLCSCTALVHARAPVRAPARQHNIAFVRVHSDVWCV